MPCAACERRRQAMKEMILNAKAHAARLLALRSGATDATTTADVQPAKASRTEAQAEGSGQAEDAGAAHRDEGMAAAKGAGAGAGRVQVPRVRKARGGKAGAR